METQRALAAAAISAIFSFSSWRQYSEPVTARPPLALTTRAVAPDACSLLNEAQASTILGITSLPGKRLFGSDPRACVWSDDATAAISNRRLTLTIISTNSFDAGKTSARVTIEPLGGIGDGAYYVLYKTHESPFLNVRKGSSAFQVRVLNGLKSKAFTLDEEKAKEAAAAKLAVAKL
ncbi:MAG: hypothetical protein M3081_04225 [Gemmatimonadota bacterium]|nr:hypothetical protein [Gemmatimonadota bacterium]